jgi:hypothetical protein
MRTPRLYRKPLLFTFYVLTLIGVNLGYPFKVRRLPFGTTFIEVMG